MHKLIEIEGIGEHYAQLLHEEGLNYQEQFLSACCTRSKRKQLCKHTGISPKLILKWTNHADLTRIRGIGAEYAELLEKCGVDSVPELAHRRYDNLHHALLTTNQQYHLCRRTPGASMVKSWIEEAKHLPRAVHH